MNFEKELEEKIKNPDFSAISGSRLYGTNRKDSDTDIRGFFIRPLEALIGTRKFEQYQHPKDDTKFYSLLRFIQLACAGDPSTIELFFIPEEHIIHKTDLGKLIMDNRDLFISNRIYRRVMGYGYSEWRKAFAQKLVIGKRSKDEDDIISWIRDNKDWDKERMDTFVDWMNEGKPTKLVSTTRKLGAKRKKEFELYGFGVSSAAHSLRLIGEMIELLSTGTITFPRPNADWLRDIRQGKVSKEEVIKVHEDLLVTAEDVRDNSVLQEKPQAKKIYDLYNGIVKDVLEKRFTKEHARKEAQMV